MLFSIRITKHQNNLMLNICDSSLLGKKITDDKIIMNISKSYYCERFVDKKEARDLLKQCSSINMVGKETVALSVDLGIGSQQAIKEIDGIPFLLIFKM